MSKQTNKLLVSTWKKVASEWKKFNTKKTKILSKKTLPPEFKRGLLAEEKDKALKNISIHYEEYRGLRFAKKHKSDIDSFIFTNQYKTINTVQNTYKAKKGIGQKRLDSTIKKVLKKDKVVGVLAVLKVKDEDSGKILHISDFITEKNLKAINDRKMTVYEYVAGHARGLKSTQEFKELGIYIKVIYAKA